MAKICIVNKKKIDLFKEVYENQLQRSIVTIFSLRTLFCYLLQIMPDQLFKNCLKKENCATYYCFKNT